jgi:manganese transport protein
MAIFELTLGIISSTGGFVDLGQIIFLGQSGAKFLYALLWTIILGTVILILYGEMAGRVAAVAKMSVFDMVRETLPPWAGYIAAVFTILTTVITCAAEIGGMALVLELGFGLPYAYGVILVALVLGAIIWLAPFPWLEKSFGILGLGMLTFLAATFFLHPDWLAVLKGMVPQLPPDTSAPQLLLYAYFVVGMISAVLLPYELIFYSAGAIEQKWTVKDIFTNRIVTVVGFLFGAVAAMAILIDAAVLFLMYKIDPQLLGSTVLQAVVPFGFWGMAAALFGVFFAIAGAAVETCLSVAYLVCQFWQKPWGKSKSFKEVPIFYYAWTGTLFIAVLVALLGPSPIETAEYAVIFSVLALPLSYLAILFASKDKKIMGQHANATSINVLGWVSFAVIALVAIAAIPLLIVTSLGSIA